MIYAALTFWLLVIVMTAWGVHALWSGMVKPKVFNMMLLPGTLVAQVGHILGLLVTGGTVDNTALIRDDESGAPQTNPNPQPRIPVIGPVVVGMLPLLACAAAIYGVARFLGGSMLGRLAPGVVGPALPTSLGAVWQLLRDQISLMESMVSAVLSTNLASWQALLFWYLLVCLTIRMAPFPGMLRGALAAILVLGVAGGLASRLFAIGSPGVAEAWQVLNLVVAMLLVLLLLSLVVRGVIGLVALIRGQEPAAAPITGRKAHRAAA